MLQMLTITADFLFFSFPFFFSLHWGWFMLALTIRSRKKKKIFIIFSLSSLWWLLQRQMKAWKNHLWILYSDLDFNRKWHRYSLATWKLSWKRFGALKKIPQSSLWFVFCVSLHTDFGITCTCVSVQCIP